MGYETGCRAECKSRGNPWERRGDRSWFAAVTGRSAQGVRKANEDRSGRLLAMHVFTVQSRLLGAGLPGRHAAADESAEAR
jgi:hypothetical protein